MLETALFALRRVENDLVVVAQQCKLVALQAQQEDLRLHKKTVDGERSEGVLKMAANTSELPLMAMSISGALRTLFTMTKVPG